MTLWYRCEMCSPNQSRSFDVEQENPSLNEAMQLVEDHHKKTSSKCPATKGCSSIEILIRMVQ
jgi:hypothetical protein